MHEDEFVVLFVLWAVARSTRPFPCWGSWRKAFLSFLHVRLGDAL